MKYTKKEKLDIGRRVYCGEITKGRAAEEYGVSVYTARDYMRLYRDTEHLPPKAQCKKPAGGNTAVTAPAASAGMEEYEAMSRKELIRELVMSKINEARLKKGYRVKGAGAEKEYIPLGSGNTR